MTCACNIFLGSVDEIKGIEARVVFFLHAVEKFKAGHVKKEEVLEDLAMGSGQVQEREGQAQGGKETKRKEVDTRKSRLLGNMDQYEDSLLLHTEPYYLAITRSTCEVTNVLTVLASLDT